MNFAAQVWYVLPEHDFDTVSWMLWRNKLYALPSSDIGRHTVCLSDGNAQPINVGFPPCVKYQLNPIGSACNLLRKGEGCNTVAL